jgi:hypothetical protein
MPDLDELYPGRFLKGRTLNGPKLIRIVSMNGDFLETDENRKEFKAILKFKDEEGDGEIVWNKTNALLTAELYGREYEKWAGQLIVIFFDPDVRFGSEKPGGIRVWGAPASVLPKAKQVSIKRPRRKKPDVFTLHPWSKQAAAAPQKQQPAAQMEPGPSGTPSAA